MHGVCCTMINTMDELEMMNQHSHMTTFFKISILQQSSTKMQRAKESPISGMLLDRTDTLTWA